MSESRFWELDIRFIDERGRLYKLSELDRPFADYIARAKPTRSVFSVYCPEAQRKDCGRTRRGGGRKTAGVESFEGRLG